MLASSDVGGPADSPRGWKVDTASDAGHGSIAPPFTTVDRALALIQPGSRVYLGTGCAAPRTLLAALEAAQPGPADLELVSFVTTDALPHEDGTPRTRHRHVITDGVVDLAEAGVVTGRRKGRQPGRVVTSCALGTRRLYDYVHDNPRFAFLPIEQVCDPAIVSSNAVVS